MQKEYSKPDGYMPRIVDKQIESFLKIFGAIEITGTKWCGKTWSALQHGASVTYVDENIELAKDDPSMMLLGDAPHVIDEWQRVPQIWDAARHQIDKNAKTRGAYILTGSSTPKISSNSTPTHSGAGRFGKIRMYPMSLTESGESSAKVSLADLFNEKFKPCRVEKNTMELVNLVCRGGWPEAIDLEAKDALFIAREYIKLTCENSMPSLGFDASISMNLLNSIARNLGQSATYRTLAKDVFGESNAENAKSHQEIIRRYLNAFSGMFLIEEVGGWAPQARDRKRFLTKPKRYFADPSLACAILGMSTDNLLNDWQTFGLLFENLVIRDLSVYAQSLDLLDGKPVRYYRDDSGLECDAVIQLADGRWAAFEIKSSEEKVAKAIKNLKKLRKKLCVNPKSQTKEPTFMAVITGIGEYAREVEDGIFVIPIRALTC